MLIVKYVGIILIKHQRIFVGKIATILRTLKDTWKEVKMISIKELKKKAKEILAPLEGLTVGEGINAMTLALSWLIESNVKKEERGECVENITEMLKTLLVEGGEE